MQPPDTPPASTPETLPGAEATVPADPVAPTPEQPPQRASLAVLLDGPLDAAEPPQSSPQKHAAPPCKPPRTGQPQVQLAVVCVIIALLLGVVISAAVKHITDTNKPRVPPQRMPMKVIEGQRVYE